MKKNEIVKVIEPVLKVFEELGILYYIGGSVASSAYGVARTTLDVDVVINLLSHHIDPLVDKLKDQFYIDKEMIFEAIDKRSSFNILHLESMLKIDFFILKDIPYHQRAFERKVKDKLTEETETISIYLSSPEDIILNKLLWFKAGNEISEKQWLDILGVIKVQNKKLDIEYLKYWAKNLSILKLLEKAFSESKLEL